MVSGDDEDVSLAVVRRLSALYKACVTYCRSLSDRLQNFLLDKQRLMERFNGIAAEKLIYKHAVHMVGYHTVAHLVEHGINTTRVRIPITTPPMLTMYALTVVRRCGYWHILHTSIC